MQVALDKLSLMQVVLDNLSVTNELQTVKLLIKQMYNSKHITDLQSSSTDFKVISNMNTLHTLRV